MMSKFMRVISTLMIITGLVFLFVYIQSLRTDNTDILNRPSYYIARNYWFMFVAGIIVIIFSILGSFFSWFKIMDPVKEALPNAGYASSSDINTWVSGTTVDAGAETEILTENIESSSSSKTEILKDLKLPLKETEILIDGQDSEGSATEIIREGDDTL
ncbi:hypothetical protein C809_00172 [Lachnospiraceae bacterium MD335]|nr:hypothetical protein C809_00172 [Lachnospiraceae bacterium MD335]